MVLTALFALSFSGLSLDVHELLHASMRDALSAILLIGVGVAIDSGKYLFWSRGKRPGFKLLSLCLALFSWLASVAFFLAGESTLELQQRTASPQYQAHQTRIAMLQQDIAQREELVERHLSSQYHTQWQQGQQQMQALEARREQLSEWLAAESHVLASADVATPPSQQLFRDTAVVMGTETQTVRLLFFAVLALLIEVSALGLIRLRSEACGRNNINQSTSVAVKQSSNKPDSTTADTEVNNSRRAQLLRDIVIGKQAPVLRHIKKAGYGLSNEAIRAVLDALKQQGFLEPDQRNSLKLADLDTNANQQTVDSAHPP